MNRRLFTALAMLVLAVLACTGPSQGPTVEQATATPPPPEPTTAPNPTATIQPVGGSSGGDLTPEQIEQIARASIQILAEDGSGQALWTGSGTIIEPTGEILTNCHVACDAPVMKILITETPDQPPVERYIAEITHADPELDLALIQIVADANGSPLTPTGLPFLPVGDSNSLRLGDPVRVFGYPGVGGETITFTSGSVSGFITDGGGDRVAIKTDADIASGNSGGTAVNLNGQLVGVPTFVNPDIRDGVTIGGIGVLRPVNLITVVRNQPAEPGTDGGGMTGQPENDPDPNEPNDTLADAVPLNPGDVVEGYITWSRDFDVFVIDTQTTQPIEVALTDVPSGSDYDLYVVDEEANTLAQSENEGSQSEQITYTPPTDGRYWIVVIQYNEMFDPGTPYRLAVNYDGGGSSSGGGSPAGGITLSGTLINGETSRPLPTGTIFGILEAGATCNDLVGGSSKDLNFDVVLIAAETNSQGRFSLANVPRGNDYTVFILVSNDYICETDWLNVPSDAIDTDLDEIEVSF